MNCDKIRDHMIEAENDARFIQALDSALRELATSGMDPYMIALKLVDLSAKVVLTSLPNEEFAFYGKYLGDVSARIGRNAVAKEAALLSLTQAVDGSDLRELT